MASLMGSIPVPRYEMQSVNEVSEARMDLVLKVCEYLVQRLASYIDNIKRIKLENRNPRGESKEPCKLLIMKNSWSTIFDAEPLAHGRRVSSTLFDVVSSVDQFWGVCEKDNFTDLRTICQARAGQPRHLLRKHFLFFKHLFAYLDYVGGVVQHLSWEQFNEFEELSYFLNLLVATQFLVSDLLDLNTTPTGRTRTRVRNYDALLYGQVNEFVGLMTFLRGTWHDARGNVTTEYINADEPCAKGDFSVLGQRNTADDQEPTSE